jgi:hypothetical protein
VAQKPEGSPLRLVASGIAVGGGNTPTSLRSLVLDAAPRRHYEQKPTFVFQEQPWLVQSDFFANCSQ